MLDAQVMTDTKRRAAERLEELARGDIQNRGTQRLEQWSTSTRDV
jgi:hypothetical protein